MKHTETIPDKPGDTHRFSRRTRITSLSALFAVAVGGGAYGGYKASEAQETHQKLSTVQAAAAAQRLGHECLSLKIDGDTSQSTDKAGDLTTVRHFKGKAGLICNVVEYRGQVSDIRIQSDALNGAGTRSVLELQFVNAKNTHEGEATSWRFLQGGPSRIFGIKSESIYGEIDSLGHGDSWAQVCTSPEPSFDCAETEKIDLEGVGVKQDTALAIYDGVVANMQAALAEN